MPPASEIVVKEKFFLEIEKNSKRNEFNKHLLSASLVLGITLNGKNTKIIKFSLCP